MAESRDIVQLTNAITAAVQAVQAAQDARDAAANDLQSKQATLDAAQETARSLHDEFSTFMKVIVPLANKVVSH